jgi:phage shock protein PspC (stress-responsive transcriptional regulator)
MNKVIIINLNGNAYQLEEGGYDALRSYLDAAARRLEGNPDRDEIIADIEQAIADKIRALLSAAKTVVVTKEVGDIIEEMGPVEASGSPGDPPPGAGEKRGFQAAGSPGEPPETPKRLYKIRDGAKVCGVCNGLAAYFNIDVTIVRIVFAFLVFAWGSGLLLYIVMALILPSATTPAEIAAAHGTPSATAEEFIRRAREGYYEGMRSFGDKRARREWKRRFKSEMRGWKKDFQQQVHASADSWRHAWHPNSPPGTPPPAPGAWYPVSTLLHTLLTILLVCALVSLATTHRLFGWWLPGGIPFWGWILIIVALYNFLLCPIRALHGPQPSGYGNGPFRCFWHICMWVGIIWFVIWLLNGHSGDFRDTLEHLPLKLRHAADSVGDWWNQQ